MSLTSDKSRWWCPLLRPALQRSGFVPSLCVPVEDGHRQVPLVLPPKHVPCCTQFFMVRNGRRTRRTLDLVLTGPSPSPWQLLQLPKKHLHIPWVWGLLCLSSWPWSPRSLGWDALRAPDSLPCRFSPEPAQTHSTCSPTGEGQFLTKIKMMQWMPGELPPRSNSGFSNAVFA